jgi:TolB-like protein
VKKGAVTIIMVKNNMIVRYVTLFVLCVFFAGCPSSGRYYVDPNMDFGAIKTVAIMPFENLASEKTAGDRVRDVFTNILLSSGEIYALPPGEVARAALRAGISTPSTPSIEEIIKLGAITKVNAVITGVVREYGEVRSGGATANIVSFSLQMIEVQSGKIIWSADSTKGGIGAKDRLLGGGGNPLNDVTEEAVNDILNKYFR